MNMNDEIAEFVKRELVTIFDESGIPVALETTDQERLDRLNGELAKAIREGRYPLSALHEIRQIYSKRKGEGNA